MIQFDEHIFQMGWNDQVDNRSKDPGGLSHSVFCLFLLEILQKKEEALALYNLHFVAQRSSIIDLGSMKTLELNRFCKQTNRSATEIVNLFVIYRRVVRSIE